MIDRRGAWARRLFRAPTRLYRWRLGWVLGHRFVLLEHYGRRTGRRYETVLEVVKWEPDGEVVVVSGWGRAADWYRNVLARPVVTVTLATRRFPATHRVLSPDEAARVLADYEDRNRYLRPVINRVLSRLAGWRYDGSDQARRRLTEQLPLVALRPTAVPTVPTDTHPHS
ncbi:MAG TPA: nitroreductase family deazaflavin-dependent oxidoreductase [Acidimicrobiales bacterium]|nr:nitroreductase family deazaflavin-dependent oxidoreductase [Acidimicrobiales bacterium]